MLSVLLFILKMIGLILLALILLIALILIVPIRYQFVVNKIDGKKPYACVKISWFIYLFHGKLEYVNGKIPFGAKIFWYQILGNQEEFLKLKEERKKKKVKKDKKKSKSEKKKKEKKDETAKEETRPLELPATVEETETAEEILIEEDKDIAESDLSEEKTIAEDTKAIEPAVSKKKKRKKKKDSHRKTKDAVNPLEKLKELKKKLQEQAEEYHLQDNLPWAKKILIKTLKHILPRRIKGYVDYGFENPATTGYITALAAIFYPRYAKTLRVTPDFQDSILEAELSGKGAIRIGYIIYIAILVILNKDVRKLIFK